MRIIILSHKEIKLKDFYTFLKNNNFEIKNGTKHIKAKKIIFYIINNNEIVILNKYEDNAKIYTINLTINDHVSENIVTNYNRLQLCKKIFITTNEFWKKWSKKWKLNDEEIIRNNLNK